MAGWSPKLRLAAWVASGVIGGGLITGAVVSQLGVATAAGGSSPSANRPSSAPGHGMRPLMRGGFGLRRGLDRGMGGGLGLGLGAGGQVLHGQATVQKPGGGTQVVTLQTGTISAVSGDMLTVASSDGYSASYTVDRATRIVLNGADGAVSSLKKGDSVRVVAVKQNGGWHALAVRDGLPSRPPWGRPGGAQPAPPAPARSG